VFEVELGPLNGDTRRGEFTLRFPAESGRPEHLFLLCHYKAQSDCGDR
jgi:hypothetical protein